MSEMLDLYINVCLKVSGKKNLEAKETNQVIDYHTSLLKGLKIVEERQNGKTFKAWVTNLDEFRHELISKDVLICSRRVRFEVRDPYPHGDNHMDSVNAKIHRALMELKVHHALDSKDEIIIEVIDTHIAGNTRTGRWPVNEFDKMTF